METPARIPVVDGNPGIREVLCDYLGHHGYEASGAASASEMDRALATSAIDLIVLDLMTPGEDGLSVVRRLRRVGSPIVMLSAMGEVTDRIVGSNLAPTPISPSPAIEQAPPSLRDRMVADVEEMDALIGQAMAFVRGEAQAERRELLDLDALVRDCAVGFSETGASVIFDGGAELEVQGDPAALRRAVANLIENAVTYADAARVRTFALDGQAVISVEDDGPGLPEEELEAVFEPFARGERSRNRETGGAGLGLSVARQAARAGNGDVHLINGPEGGLLAILTFRSPPGRRDKIVGKRHSSSRDVTPAGLILARVGSIEAATLDTLASGARP